MEAKFRYHARTVKLVADALRKHGNATSSADFLDEAHAEIVNAYDELAEILDDCRAYFDNRSDVSDGDYGIPEANEEMRMVARIDAVLNRSASLKERAA